MRALILILALSSLWAELPPQGITVSQWVREDIFAGMLGNDLPTFEKGMAKTRELLAVDPNNDEARAWLAGGQIYLAARTYKTGNTEKGSTQLAAAVGNAHQALAKKDPSAIRILGGSFVLMADRFPEEQKMALLKDGRSLFAIVRKQDDPMLERMPEHMKGEVLAGQAQAAMRLGLQEEATKYLNEIVAKLPNTHYASTAEKWLADPASSAKSQLVCQSCHEPNRLANRLKAVSVGLGLK